MATKRNDGTGFQPGAMGIDGRKGENFTKDDVEDRHFLSRSWDAANLTDEDFRAMKCDYKDDVTPNSEVLAGAREGNKPLLGRGNPRSPEQTGWRRESPKPGNLRP